MRSIKNCQHHLYVEDSVNSANVELLPEVLKSLQPDGASGQAAEGHDIIVGNGARKQFEELKQSFYEKWI